MEVHYFDVKTRAVRDNITMLQRKYGNLWVTVFVAFTALPLTNTLEHEKRFNNINHGLQGRFAFYKNPNDQAYSTALN